ncbi:hypothetical protein FRC01_006736 [Tulasnella sp. 417]|nr:hypothetical protein FRC01_006736 [Tulasnella sp. 417]
MSAPSSDFLANNNLPSRETIVAQCEKAGYDCRGIPLRDQSSGSIVAWVKYGPNVARAEALTQDFAAKALSDNAVAGVRVPRVYDAFSVTVLGCPIGYIVMEYIDAPDCGCGDEQLVARAVQALINVQTPDTTPGPVGGGRVFHTFFTEWTSPVAYDTVEQLQQHINGILQYMNDTRRVDLVADAGAGLRLCPCDITPENFKACPDGTVVALDFRATCFLPPSFFAVTIRRQMGSFAWKVAKLVKYPQSSDVEAMVAASYFLVPYGRSDIG